MPQQHAHSLPQSSARRQGSSVHLSQFLEEHPESPKDTKYVGYIIFIGTNKFGKFAKLTCHRVSPCERQEPEEKHVQGPDSESNMTTPQYTSQEFFPDGKKDIFLPLNGLKNFTALTGMPVVYELRYTRSGPVAVKPQAITARHADYHQVLPYIIGRAMRRAHTNDEFNIKAPGFKYALPCIWTRARGLRPRANDILSFKTIYHQNRILVLEVDMLYNQSDYRNHLFLGDADGEATILNIAKLSGRTVLPPRTLRLLGDKLKFNFLTTAVEGVSLNGDLFPLQLTASQLRKVAEEYHVAAPVDLTLDQIANWCLDELERKIGNEGDNSQLKQLRQPKALRGFADLCGANADLWRAVVKRSFDEGGASKFESFSLSYEVDPNFTKDTFHAHGDEFQDPHFFNNVKDIKLLASTPVHFINPATNSIMEERQANLTRRAIATVSHEALARDELAVITELDVNLDPVDEDADDEFAHMIPAKATIAVPRDEQSALKELQEQFVPGGSYDDVILESDSVRDRKDTARRHFVVHCGTEAAEEQLTKDILDNGAEQLEFMRHRTRVGSQQLFVFYTEPDLFPIRHALDAFGSQEQMKISATCSLISSDLSFEEVKIQAEKYNRDSKAKVNGATIIHTLVHPATAKKATLITKAAAHTRRKGAAFFVGGSHMAVVTGFLHNVGIDRVSSIFKDKYKDYAKDHHAHVVQGHASQGVRLSFGSHAALLEFLKLPHLTTKQGIVMETKVYNPAEWTGATPVWVRVPSPHVRRRTISLIKFKPRKSDLPEDVRNGLKAIKLQHQKAARARAQATEAELKQPDNGEEDEQGSQDVHDMLNSSPSPMHKSSSGNKKARKKAKKKRKEQHQLKINFAPAVSQDTDGNQHPQHTSAEGQGSDSDCVVEMTPEVQLPSRSTVCPEKPPALPSRVQLPNSPGSDSSLGGTPTAKRPCINGPRPTYASMASPGSQVDSVLGDLGMDPVLNDLDGAPTASQTPLRGSQDRSNGSSQ